MPATEKVKTMQPMQEPLTARERERAKHEAIGAVRDLLSVIEELERGDERRAREHVRKAVKAVDEVRLSIGDTPPPTGPSPSPIPTKPKL